MCRATAGWITSTMGAKLSFPVKFGPEPRLAVTVLRGYEGFGDIRLTVNERRSTIKGMWPPDHAKVTVSATVWYLATWNGNQEAQLGEGGVTGFAVKPNSEHVVTIEYLGCAPARRGAKETDGCKFKLISLATC